MACGATVLDHGSTVSCLKVGGDSVAYAKSPLAFRTTVADAAEQVGLLTLAGREALGTAAAVARQHFRLDADGTRTFAMSMSR